MRRPIRKLALAWLILGVLGTALQAEDRQFVVALDGNDANPGTAARPFASLERAQAAVREVVRAGLNGNVTVLLRKGSHRLGKPLRFGPADGGNSKFSVTYAAWPGEKPHLSGGQRLTGWKTTPDGRWTTRVSRRTFRELFVNGQRRPRARHPNEGFLRIEKAAADRRTGFTFKPGDLPKFENISDTELVFLHDWCISRIPLQTMDPDRRVLTTAYPVGCAAPHYAIDHFEKQPRYFLENSPTFLDVPGEWHLASSGELTYFPKAGEQPDTVEVVAPVATALLEVRGELSATRSVVNLHFRGLTLEHCAWFPPQRGYAEGQAGFYELRDQYPEKPPRAILPAAVVFELTETCSFTECRLAHLGASGLLLGRACRTNSLVGCVIEDIAGNGVLIGETANRPKEVATGNRVENCLIQDCGTLYYGSVGVWVGIARDTRIAHNEIRQLPYTGVSVGWRWDPTPTACGGNVVEHNHIHHLMQKLSDGGGIYTLGRQPGTVLRRNHIHDVPVNAGRAESNGMFLDEGTTEIVIEDNVIYSVARSPLRFHKAGKNTVRGNHLFVGKGIPPVRYNNTPEANLTLEHNTVIAEADSDPAKAAEKLEAGLQEKYRRLGIEP